MPELVFSVISALLILSCIGVCVSKNLVHSAVFLFFALFLIAGLYIMLYADFLAAVQVIVYVGGILVLIIFGVMLTNRLEKPSIDISSFNQLTAGLLCFFLFLLQCYAIINGEWINYDSGPIENSSKEIGRLILSKHLLPFEVISVLLLGVLIGAATIARKKR
jgi:NADH:ubiquinone oxidoreductase subunit 6 (subunit J)